MSIELEIKAELPENFNPATALVDFSLTKTSTEIDQYFDTSDACLFKQGIFLRVRDGSRFDIKYNPNLTDISHLSCSEYNFSFPLKHSDAIIVSEFLAAARIPLKETNSVDIFLKFELVEFLKVNKNRIKYENTHFEIVIDEITNLGSYIEIEAKSPEDLSKLLDMQRQLKLIHLPIGYVELFLKKHNYSLYMSGRYLLPEDRKA